MEIRPEQIRRFRLAAHHLDQKCPPEGLLAATGACGVQNSPPGAWETALFQRVEGCTLDMLYDALYGQKSLLQAWSFRGAPVIFPSEESPVFLTALLPQPGEEPWIYTQGIGLALDWLGMTFDQLLPLAKRAAACLESRAIQTKEALDQTLADQIVPWLPEEKRPLWNAPSMYGRPDRQTVGGAVVPFLLRPCAFSSLVVFGQRSGIHPTFTSYARWLGHPPAAMPQAEQILARKFLHCYGPATPQAFASWLGCTPRQAKRLWNGVAPELTAVTVAGKPCWVLRQDLDALQNTPPPAQSLLLLGPHDPYLDVRDRAVLLPQAQLHKQVWKTVANPGVILREGEIVGIWKSKKAKDRLDVTFQPFQPLSGAEIGLAEQQARQWTAFQGLRPGNFTWSPTL